MEALAPVKDKDQDKEKPSYLIAKQTMTAFSGAYKKLNLYSKSHAVYINALNLLFQIFADHFNYFGNLKIRIQRNQILYGNEVIYEGSSEPTDLVFILHRDGILSIEFQEGLELWELDTLLTILHDYCVLPENAEDDIVTALWKFNLPSIHYIAAELELGQPDDLAFTDPPDDSDEKVDDPGKTEPEIAQNNPDEADDFSPLERHNKVFQLTRDEREQLRKMVVLEEQLDNTDYVIDVLLYILEQHSLPEDVEDLLGTLTQELGDALSKARFAYLHAVVLKLERHLENLKTADHWSAPHMARFLDSLAGHSFLDHLRAISPSIDETAPESLKDLKKLLLLLDNKAVAVLGPMMLLTQSAGLQKVLIGTIAAMADRDLSPLQESINGAEATLATRLVFVLGFLKDERSRVLLSQLLGHEAVPVRRQALKAILARDTPSMEELFSLINDPDETIRKRVLQHFARERSVRVEKLLLRYLETEQVGAIDDDHFLAICRVLGRCGSDQSIYFLTKQLFRWPFFGILRSAVSRQRRGAILALEGIHTKKAIHLAQRSKRGFWRNFLRSA